MTTTLERCLTTTQVANRLGLSPQRIVQLADQLPHVRTPHGRLFDPAGVEAFAAQRRQQSGAAAPRAGAPAAP